jgi:hypothetical protein
MTDYQAPRKMPEDLLERVTDIAYYFRDEYAQRLKHYHKFTMNHLASFSNIAKTNRSGFLQPFYYFGDLLDRDNLMMYMNGFMDSSRPEDDEAFGELDIKRFFNYNSNGARKAYDDIIGRKLKYNVSFRYANTTEQPELTYYSKSLNYIFQRIFSLAGYYKKDYPILQAVSTARGTAYTRLDYMVGTSGGADGKTNLQEKYNFHTVPEYLVFDDMIPGKTELYQSDFVCQIHYLTRESAEQVLTNFLGRKSSKVSDILESLEEEYPDYDFNLLMNFDEFWQGYSFHTEQYELIELIECFWKHYTDEFGNFIWMRSFLASSMGGTTSYLSNSSNAYHLTEMPGTRQSTYAMGMPLIKKRHERNADSRFGYTPIADYISLDQITNAVKNRYVNKLYEESFSKRFFSSRVRRLVDENGYEGIRGYMDQVFKDFNVGSGESINNHVSQLNPAEVNASLINFLDKLEAGERVDQYQAYLDKIGTRTSFSTAQLITEQAGMKDVPFISEDEIYFVEMAHALYDIYTQEYDDVRKELLFDELGSVVMGLGLKDFDPSVKPPELGIEVQVVDKSSAVRANALDALPQVGGMQAILGEGGDVIANMLNLDEIGFERPNNLDIQNTLMLIDRVMDGKITRMAEAESYIFGTVDNPEVCVATIDRFIKSHKMQLVSGDSKTKELLVEIRANYLMLLQQPPQAVQGAQPPQQQQGNMPVEQVSQGQQIPLAGQQTQTPPDTNQNEGEPINLQV